MIFIKELNKMGSELLKGGLLSHDPIQTIKTNGKDFYHMSLSHLKSTR